MRALFILGGWLIQEKGAWRLPRVGEPAEKGLPDNSALRVEAAVCFWKKYPDTRVIVSGGSGRLAERGAPSVASVMKDALVERGIPAENVKTEEHSTNTWQQIKVLGRFMADSKKKFGPVTVVSNEWHLPRINAFISRAPEPFKKVIAGIQVRSAEEILLECGGRWRETVEEARRASGLKERQKLEARGIAALEAGKYQFRR